MPRVNQWPSHRSSFSDWRTDRETERNSRGSLEYQSLRLASHPLPMGLAEIAVGLMPLGIDPVVLNDLSSTFTVPEELIRDQWLSQREQISGWRSPNRSFAGSMVSLDSQPRTVSAHPLPMEFLDGVGSTLTGHCDESRSRFAEASLITGLLLDFLSTEDFRPIITEDTGEPLGLG